MMSLARGRVLFSSLLLLAGTLGAAEGVLEQSSPSRIVSLVPAATEMLFAVGAGPQVVGVSSYDSYPPEVSSRVRVGALIDPDLERILGLRPDLVIIYASQDDLRRQLTRASIPFIDYRHAGLHDITKTLRTLGARVGHEQEANALASSIEQRLDAIRRHVAARPRPRVMLVFGRETGTLRNVYASGGRGFLHDMLVAAGGENVFADMARESIQATSELILARRPEVIIEVRATDPSGGIGRDAAWDSLSSVPAVRNKRIISFFGGEYVVPGPRVADAVDRLAKALHPKN